MDIQSTPQAIRKVLGEIPLLASEQRFSNEANGAEETDGNASGKKDDKPKPGAKRACLFFLSSSRESSAFNRQLFITIQPNL